jgi:hypothetical protein
MRWNERLPLFSAGKSHVSNAPAIALYRRLGFTLRRQLQLAIMSASDN